MASFSYNVPFEFQTRGHSTILHHFVTMLPWSPVVRQFLSSSLLFMTDRFEDYFIAQSPIYSSVFSHNWTSFWKALPRSEGATISVGGGCPCQPRDILEMLTVS